MNAKGSLVPLVILFLGVLELVEARTEPPAPLLFQSTEREGLVKPEVDPTVIRQRKIVVDLDLVRSPKNPRITFPLFDGVEVLLVRDKQEMPRENTRIWYGSVEGQPGSTALWSNVGDALAGDVVTRDRFGRFRFYQIRYLGNGVHVLREVDQSRFPAEDPPNEPEIPPADPGGDPCEGDSGASIDVLVLYTGSARHGARNTDPGSERNGIEAEISLAVAGANLSYEKSEVLHRLRLVHMEEVVYSEAGKTPTKVLAELQGGAGNLAKALSLRDTHSADVVVLVVSSFSSCGKANLMSTVSPSFEAEAFAVVRRNCAVTNHSFAHEIGHIMGARHDWANETTPTPPVVYAHGYVQTPTPSVTPWRTIMSIAPGSTRIGQWSNPSVGYPPGGAPTGIATGPHPADNHRRLNETALTVANFRCSD